MIASISDAFNGRKLGSLLLAFFILACTFAHAEGVVDLSEVSCGEILATSLNTDDRLPNYSDFRRAFLAVDQESALNALQGALNGETLSREQKLSAMVAFLDREQDTYQKLIRALPSFVTSSSWLPRKAFTRKRDNQLVLGRLKVKSREEAVEQLLELASVLIVMPTQSNLWSRSLLMRRKNGVCTTDCGPTKFVESTLAKLQEADQRLSSTYDFLRGFDPSLKLESLNPGPKRALTMGEILTPLSMAFMPIAGQYMIYGGIKDFADPAILAGAATLLVYRPLHGGIKDVTSQARLRMKTYWYTSNLARAVILAFLYFRGHEAYNFVNHEIGQIRMQVTGVARDAKSLVEVNSVKQMNADSYRHETEYATEAENNLVQQIQSLKAQNRPELSKEIAADRISLQHMIQRHGNYIHGQIP